MYVRVWLLSRIGYVALVALQCSCLSFVNADPPPPPYLCSPAISLFSRRIFCSPAISLFSLQTKKILTICIGSKEWNTPCRRKLPKFLPSLNCVNCWKRQHPFSSLLFGNCPSLIMSTRWQGLVMSLWATESSAEWIAGQGSSFRMFYFFFGSKISGLAFSHYDSSFGEVCRGPARREWWVKVLALIRGEMTIANPHHDLVSTYIWLHW